MARFLIVLLSVFSFVTAQAADPVAKKPLKEKLKYAAKDSTEAWLSFDYFVDFQGSGTDEAAKVAIGEQVQHMYGPMGEAVGVAGMLAVPKNKYTAKVTKIESRGRGQRAHYSYKGLIALQKGEDSKYTIVLPRDPASIYSDSLKDSHNPCTDEHYQSEGDFWYFWNPEKSGCGLEEGKHYDVLDARNNNLKVVRRPNTEKSYPEYARLVR